MASYAKAVRGKKSNSQAGEAAVDVEPQAEAAEEGSGPIAAALAAAAAVVVEPQAEAAEEGSDAIAAPLAPQAALAAVVDLQSAQVVAAQLSIVFCFERFCLFWNCF